ncbi:MAG: tRNA pseudouridine(55) synthase TruB, partial [Planctomycetes bacterium]|nr:tRNA pseudouridine(55) synthase TruB [Planctomycetota bacterium]
MFGILNLNKPIGWTSRDAVNRVQRLVRPAKAGHAGTLDPLATGVLVVCIGPATRLISYVQAMPKVYQATFLLGRTSDSDDIETEVRELASPPQPSREEIESKLPDFLGEIQQRPPAYSALKVNGQRAYKLAREGLAVQLEPRPVEIYELRVTGYNYPELKINLRCGSGTYVRSLGRDLAEALGTGA